MLRPVAPGDGQTAGGAVVADRVVALAGVQLRPESVARRAGAHPTLRLRRSSGERWRPARVTDRKLSAAVKAEAGKHRVPQLNVLHATPHAHLPGDDGHPKAGKLGIEQVRQYQPRLVRERKFQRRSVMIQSPITESQPEGWPGCLC